MILIDSHCHLHDSEFYDEDSQTRAYQDSIQAGVVMICVGTDVRSSRQAVDFATQHDAVWAVVGIHPHDAKDNNVDEIRKLLSSGMPQIVGIGEIGLDYYYENSDRQTQQHILRQQLHLATEFNLPVSFHVRDERAGQGAVWHDFWAIFDEFETLRGVLHSFTDSIDNLDKALARGLFIGVNGISTFTKDAAQQMMFNQIPLERMLLETDAPFLTPAPLRGKMNIPAYVRQIAEFHAQARSVGINEIATATTDNARHMFEISV